MPAVVLILRLSTIVGKIQNTHNSCCGKLTGSRVLSSCIIDNRRWPWVTFEGYFILQCQIQKIQHISPTMQPTRRRSHCELILLPYLSWGQDQGRCLSRMSVIYKCRDQVVVFLVMVWYRTLIVGLSHIRPVKQCHWR